MNRGYSVPSLTSFSSLSVPFFFFSRCSKPGAFFYTTRRTVFTLFSGQRFIVLSREQLSHLYPVLDLASIDIDLSYTTIKHQRKEKVYYDACKNGLASLFCFSKQAMGIWVWRHWPPEPMTSSTSCWVDPHHLFCAEGLRTLIH